MPYVPLNNHAPLTSEAPDADIAGASSVSGREAADCLSSLDHLETNAPALPRWAMRDLHDPIAATRAQRALHARHWKERSRLIRVLLEAPVEQLQKRALRLDGCCQRPQLHEHPDGSVSLALRCCRDRLCPRCQRARGLELASRIRTLISRMNAPRFVTLTMKHRPETLRESHDRLQKAFRKLRKEPLFQTCVVSGLYVVEITRNDATQRWHTHLHLVVDGSFIPQKSLSAAWKRSTGDSEIVDVRAVHDRKNVASYIANYVAKPQALHTWKADAILEFADHMHGRRMVATFGRCHAINIDPKEEPEIPRCAKYMGDVVSMVDRATHGCRIARKACEVLRKLGPIWQMSLGIHPDQCTAQVEEISPAEWKFVKLACVSEDFGSEQSSETPRDSKLEKPKQPRDSEQLQFRPPPGQPPPDSV